MSLFEQQFSTPADDVASLRHQSVVPADVPAQVPAWVSSVVRADVSVARGSRVARRSRARDSQLDSAEIAELFRIAAEEGAVIARLTECADRLRTVQDAKSALARLSAADVRAALRHRHLALVEPPITPTERSVPGGAPAVAVSAAACAGELEARDGFQEIR